MINYLISLYEESFLEFKTLHFFSLTLLYFKFNTYTYSEALDENNKHFKNFFVE